MHWAYDKARVKEGKKLNVGVGHVGMAAYACL